MAVVKGGLFLRKEDATGDIDGLNKTFNTSFAFLSDSLRVLLNGIELRESHDYNIVDSITFELLEAPIGGPDPDVVTVSYQRI